MSLERKQPRVGFWCSIVLAAMLIAYPLSMGPANWLRETARNSDWRSALVIHEMFVAFYRPMFWLERNGPQWLLDAMAWYAQLFR
jgi:hypothetical protein